MKKENGEIVCDDCGLSLGFYESTADEHYCTTCSFKPKRVYELRFNRAFHYAARWTKGDEQRKIDKLKKSCLEGVKYSLKYLSTLQDDKLLEILEEVEYDEKRSPKKNSDL